MTSELFKPQDPAIRNNFIDIDDSVELGSFKPLTTNSGFGDIYKVKGMGVFSSSTYALKKIKGHSEQDMRFQKEWQALKYFNELSHQRETYQKIHIPLGRIEVYEKDYCIIMPWVEGKVLGEIMRQQQSAEEKEKKIINFLKDTLNTLGLIHQKYIHRDLNPRNIIQNSKGEFIIIDFGIVYEHSILAPSDPVSSSVSFDTAARKTEVFINGGYSSQEINPCPASDIYSLGAIAIAWLTQKSPSEFIMEQGMPNQKVKTTTHPNQLKAVWDNYRKSSKINPVLGDIISQMVELTNPKKRYQTCQEVFNALEAIKIEEQRIKGSLDSWTGISDYYSYFVENSSPPTN